MPRTLVLGPVQVAFVDSRAAQLFHVVDELSGWYRAAHAQYAEWAARDVHLEQSERAMLAKHAKLRRKRRRGGLEQAFEVDLPLRDAVRTAVEKKLLTPEDAAEEQALLEHFEPRLAPLLDASAKPIADLERRLADAVPRASTVFSRLGRFCEVTEPLPVRAVLVPSPTPEGAIGRATRASIVLEVPTSEDAVTTFFHHLSHTVLQQRRGTIAMGIEKCDEATDDATVEDALAYAVAPGMLSGGGPGADALGELVLADKDASLRDPRVRAERLGLALRTELGAALEGGHDTMGTFVPKVCDAWANVAKP